MTKKPKQLPTRYIKLHGQLYMHGRTGQVEMRYGEGGWHKTSLGSIKGTKAYDAVRDSYGQKNGAKIRKAAALAIVRSLRFKKPS